MGKRIRRKCRPAAAFLLGVYLLLCIGINLPSFHTCSLGHTSHGTCGHYCGEAGIAWCGAPAISASGPKHPCLACHLQAIGQESIPGEPPVPVSTEARAGYVFELSEPTRARSDTDLPGSRAPPEVI
jgi:hypothetical protein